MLKTCTLCKTSKPEEDFGFRKPGQRMTWCRLCRNKQAIPRKRLWRANHKDRVKAANATRSSPTRKFAFMKNTAKVRKLAFDLTESQCIDLTSRPCEYCGGPLAKYGMGLDRIDNSLGYLFNNVLPCCTQCNVARGTFFTVDEMKQFIGPAIRAAREARLSCVCI